MQLLGNQGLGARFSRTVVGCLITLVWGICIAAETPDGVRRTLSVAPGTLDPARIYSVAENTVVLDVFEPLVAYQPDGQLRPAAAVRWEESPDGLQWTFHLRKKARWSNRVRVTAHDFVYAFRRLVDPQIGSPHAPFLQDVLHAQTIQKGEKPVSELGVYAPHPHTLVFRLSRRCPYFLQIMASPFAVPVYAPGVATHGKSFFTTPHLISNGPYRLESWTVNAQIRLVKNTYYHHEPRLSFVEWYPMDAEQALDRWRAGELDMVDGIPLSRIAWIKAHHPDAVAVAPDAGVSWLVFNVQHPVWREQATLRHALALAIDRERITDRLLGLGQQPLYRVIPVALRSGYAPAHQGEPAWARGTQTEREARARALYAQAGYSAAQPLHLDVLHVHNPRSKQLMLAIAAMWKAVLGVQIKTHVREWGVFAHERRLGTFPVMLGSWIPDFADPTAILGVFLSPSNRIGTFYQNPTFDAWVQQANLQADRQARFRALYAAEMLLADDMVVSPLYTWVRAEIVHPRLAGITAGLFTQSPSQGLYWKPAA